MAAGAFEADLAAPFGVASKGQGASRGPTLLARRYFSANAVDVPWPGANYAIAAAYSGGGGGGITSGTGGQGGGGSAFGRSARNITSNSAIAITVGMSGGIGNPSGTDGTTSTVTIDGVLVLSPDPGKGSASGARGLGGTVAASIGDLVVAGSTAPVKPGGGNAGMGGPPGLDPSVLPVFPMKFGYGSSGADVGQGISADATRSSALVCIEYYLI